MADLAYTLTDPVVGGGAALTPLEEAQRRLLEQYRHKTKIVGLLTAYMNQLDDVYDAYCQLITDRALGAAVGQQLDNLGEIVGQTRLGLADAEYEQLIRARILANKSSGTAPELYAIFTLIADSTHEMVIDENYPAEFTFTLLQNPAVDTSLFTSLLNRAKGSGIGANFVWGSLNSFQYGDNDTEPVGTSTTEGYGDSITPTTGGKYADLIVT